MFELKVKRTSKIRERIKKRRNPSRRESECERAGTKTECPFIHSTAMNVSHVRQQLGGIEIRTIKFTLTHTLHQQKIWLIDSFRSYYTRFGLKLIFQVYLPARPSCSITSNDVVFFFSLDSDTIKYILFDSKYNPKCKSKAQFEYEEQQQPNQT